MKQRLPLWLRRPGFKPGWPGMAGVAVMALCLGVHLAVLRPAQQRLDAARRSVAAMQQRLAAAGSASPEKVLSVEEQLGAFYAGFPGEQDAADAVSQVAAIAARHGLALQQADYKLERENVGKLIRLQMNLPLKGTYPTLRQFLGSLRAEMRVVALDQVQFQRQKVGDAVLDAKVRLVIFLGAAS